MCIRDRVFYTGITLIIAYLFISFYNSFVFTDSKPAIYPDTTLKNNNELPNVILIVADDLGFNDISANGNKLIETSNIDQIAKNGINFTRAYATASVCAPSRAAFLTGNYQQRYGFEFLPDLFNYSPRVRKADFNRFGHQDNFKKWYENDTPNNKRGLNPFVNTIGDYLKKMGYQTSVVGKWHMGAHPKFNATNFGFDSHYGIVGAASLYAPLNQDNIKLNFISAQYTTGENKLGYIDEEGADITSDTETFVSIKAEIQNWRWKGVPFYLRTGKRMKSKMTQIVIHFKSDGHYIFDQDSESLKGNTLIISLHPSESISLQVFTKPHGVDKHSTLRSDPMSLDFIKTQKLLNIPSGYQSLLMDILNGNQSLFLCKEEVELAWQWCDNALEANKKSNQELYFYPAGTNGPKESELLIQSNGHEWYEE